MARLLSTYLALKARLLTEIDEMANMERNQTWRPKMKITLVFESQKCALIRRFYEEKKITKIQNTLNIHDLTYQKDKK